MVVAAPGVWTGLAPPSPCINKPLARRTLVDYPNFVAASLVPFEVIFGMQAVHRSTRVFQQSPHKCRHFWCVICLLRTFNNFLPRSLTPKRPDFLKIDSTATNFDLASPRTLRIWDLSTNFSNHSHVAKPTLVDSPRYCDHFDTQFVTYSSRSLSSKMT